mmetsp:Transcript_12569/g.34860  ORF Transcript_12569/g.34860 Transcript_12569/m.34860 type:complete len:384 (+) Transcript_12569:106-1257(+)
MASNERDDYATDGQQIAVLCVSNFSSLLSIFGSTSIIYIIVRNKKCRTRQQSGSRRGGEDPSSGMFHRLMLGLSAGDCLVSLSTIIAPYLQPPDEHLLAARGSTSTCSFAGVLLYAILSAASYNSCLAFFYYKTIRVGDTEQQVSRRYEKWMHIFSVGLFVVFNAIAIPLEAYNPTESTRLCDIAQAPTNCDIDQDLECTRGQYTDSLSTTVLLLLVSLGVVGITLTTLVFIHVRQVFKASQKYRYEDQSSENKRKHRLAVQAILYCVTMVNLFLWGLSSTIFENQVPGETRAHLGRPRVFAFLILQSFFFPLQGFFNFIIYTHPRLHSNLQRFPDNTFTYSFLRLYFEEDLPQTSFQKSSVRGISREEKKTTADEFKQEGEE